MLPRIFVALIVVATTARAEIVERLPVEAFAGLPAVSQVSLAPDGGRVAVLMRPEGKDGMVVLVLDIESGEAAPYFYTDNEEFVINWIRWASDQRLLVSARFPAKRYGTPTTETRLLGVNVTSGEISNVLPKRFLRRQSWVPQFQDDIVDILPDEPDSILLALSLKQPGDSSVVRVNLVSGKVRTVEANTPHIIGWWSDRRHNIRLNLALEGSLYTIRHRPVGEKTWQSLWEFEAFSEEQVWPLGFDFASDVLFVRAYHEDKQAIFKVNLASPTKKRELVFADPEYDVNGSLIYSSKSQKVIGTTYSQHGGFTFWDDVYLALQNGLDQALPDTVNSLYSFSDDERRYVVLSTSDTLAGSYYYGNRDNKQISHLADRYDALKPELMSEKRLVSYSARDGLEIEAFLTLPLGAEKEPLPTIVFPHGGPISFDDGGFDYWTQFFANRGYAVLQMNFRGSTGYGFSFMQSGLQNWGLEMQNDVEDGTRWVIGEGIADPDRICMVGASYGGYAALMEAARNSGLYRCAVSFAGVSDIVYLLRAQKQYLHHEVAEEQIGSNKKSLRQRSPINLVDDIDIPVLLVHGTEDRSVRVRHSQRMHRALVKAGKDARYIEQDGGDHYLSKQEHRIQLFRAMDRFLREHL